MEKRGNGYDRWSMSNNARIAYKNGEKPLSRWTKSELINEIEAARKAGSIVTASQEVIKRAPVRLLKQHFLHQTSWHHTGSKFNRTPFYSLNLDALAHIDESFLQPIQEEKTKPDPERWLCSWTEWEKKSRFGRPQPVEYRSEGTILNNTFTADDGTRKMITGKSFRKIMRLD
jgi:hypothetical protein